MKRLTFSLFLISFLFFVTGLTLKAQTSDLTIQISGLKVQKGEIQLGLYNNSDAFPKENQEMLSLRLTADSSTIIHTITDLPHGDYSIAFYHDKNDDGKCNRNWIGIPTEAYGFSNNVIVKFSAPSFEKTMFKLTENTQILMTLNH